MEKRGRGTEPTHSCPKSLGEETPPAQGAWVKRGNLSARWSMQPRSWGSHPVIKGPPSTPASGLGTGGCSAVRGQLTSMPCRRRASQPAPLQPVHPQRGSEACWLSLSEPSLMREGRGPDGSGQCFPAWLGPQAKPWEGDKEGQGPGWGE